MLGIDIREHEIMGALLNLHGNIVYATSWPVELRHHGAQAVEHYEMTRYGTLVAWAKQLGRSDCAAVLQKNLDEEKAADAKLNTIAEGSVNRKAA